MCVCVCVCVYVCAYVSVCVYACVCVCVCKRKSAEAIWLGVKQWLISRLSSLEATGKNTSLPGMLDQMEVEI